MDRYRIINGKRVKLTAAEKTAREAEEAAALIKTSDTIRLEAKARRDEQMANLVVNVGDKAIQARPQDELNLRLSIADLAEGETIEWILADNTIAEVSKENLQLAYAQGLELGRAIYQEYKEVLKGL
jgi:hypothetical protein